MIFNLDSHIDDGMIIEDFAIDECFYTNSGMWKCTDIGTRVIIAVKYNGDDFDDNEVIFDEFDMGGCSLSNIFNEENEDGDYD